MGENKVKIFDKEITRKEFLIYASMALASLFGVRNFISLLSGSSKVWHSGSHNDGNDSQDGFGSRKFGA